MNKYYLIIPLILGSLEAFSRSASHNSKQSGIINVNDSAYVRILDGITINNGYVVKNYERVSIKIKDDPAHFTNKGNRNVMIIGLEVTDLESKVDSTLFSRPEFIKHYNYPLDIRLPISIDGKLLTNDLKNKSLEKITLNEIKEIEYLGTQDPKVNRKITPYGIIN